MLKVRRAHEKGTVRQNPSSSDYIERKKFFRGGQRTCGEIKSEGQMRERERRGKDKNGLCESSTAF